MPAQPTPCSAATACARALTLAGIAALASVAVGVPDALAAGGSLHGWRDAGMAWLATAGSRMGHVLSLGFEREPAVMAALAGAMLVPGLAVVVATVRRARRTRWRRDRIATSIAGPATRGRPGRAAWIEIDGERRPKLAIGELLRIGRSEECELALSDSRLADMHAVIQRNEDMDFLLIDISADARTGVSVNGQPLAAQPLRDGDLIELGASRMIFRRGEATGPASGLQSSAWAR